MQIILLFLLLNLFQLSYSMDEQLRLKGFVELPTKEFLKSDFNELYKGFDLFIDKVKKNPDFRNSVSNSEYQFSMKSDLKSRYCGAPASYRDYKMHTQKKHNKIYFQYIKEYHDFLNKKYVNIAEDNSQFFNLLKSLDKLAKLKFSKIINDLELKHPGLKALMYGKHNELTVITKIVRYEKTEKWGTTPHFDKSALSLIWDSNDEDNDSLLLCENVENPTLETLKKPQRLYTHSMDLTSTILIPGSILQKQGIMIKPTLHGVAPIKNQYRHALVSFVLIPDIDTTDIKTDFEEFKQ